MIEVHGSAQPWNAIMPIALSGMVGLSYKWRMALKPPTGDCLLFFRIVCGGAVCAFLSSALVCILGPASGKVLIVPIVIGFISVFIGMAAWSVSSCDGSGKQ